MKHLIQKHLARVFNGVRSGLRLWWLASVVLLAACASGPKWVDHAFSFNTRKESPGYEILAYRYGDGKVSFHSSDSAIRQFGESLQGDGINGPMPLGDSLYVKWRNKATEQVFEKTVDLKPLLPRDMTRQEIHFVVAEGELFVYLKDMTRYAKPSDPIVGPSKFQLFVTRQIHP